MIKALSYAARFTTGRCLSGDLSFTTGLTAITGPNEAGKSFVVEMLRYALFGTAALRGAATDYVELTTTLDFKDYVITRSLKGAKIHRLGELLATGTKPVNAKVIEVLGFGLDVFDVACVCNQGEVERLGSMLPAERKRMVDRVIGVDRIDEVQKWSAEQGSLLTREIEVLERGLVEPVQPVQPEGYQHSINLAATVAELRPLRDEYMQLQGWLQATRAHPTHPVPPAGVDATADALGAELVEIDDVAAKHRHILSLPVVDFDPELARGQWAAWDLWAERRSFELRYPAAQITREDYDHMLKHVEAQEELTAKRARLGILNRSPIATCPCGKEFYLDASVQTEMDQLLTEIELLALVVSDDTPTRRYLNEQLEQLELWATPHIQETWERLRHAMVALPPEVSRRALSNATAGVTSAERDAQLAALPAVRERSVVSSQLSALQLYAAAKQAYAQAVVEYEAWAAEWMEKKARAGDLEYVPDTLATATAQYTNATIYESQLAAYGAAQADYLMRVEELGIKSAELEGWKAAKAALVDLRTRIKTYLVPSLSRVASHLLSQMTGGQRSSIVVDENFDVMVDGQRLATLSGSGKACANLALRIGLGQVLTNNVVSLFIGDEIDASMDAERAEFTHSSLRRLTGQISQLILITHKCPAADNVITLGDNADAGRIHSGRGDSL